MRDMKSFNPHGAQNPAFGRNVYNHSKPSMPFGGPDSVLEIIGSALGLVERQFWLQCSSIQMFKQLARVGPAMQRRSQIRRFRLDVTRSVIKNSFIACIRMDAATDGSEGLQATCHASQLLALLHCYIHLELRKN